MSVSPSDVCIVGAGIMGATAAVHAAQRGARVVLVDQATLPNPRGASVDHSKVFRFAYPDPFYVRCAVAALAGWRELERACERPLLVPTGLVLLGQESRSFEMLCFEALRASGCEAEMLPGDVVARRYPQFDANAFRHGVVDPSGAIAAAEAAVQGAIAVARRCGVTVRENERVVALHDGAVVLDGGDRISAAKVMIAAGPWTRALLPELAPYLRTTRQEVFYFEPERPENFSPERFPIFIELGTGFYGFPVHHGRAMKIANHHKGDALDPGAGDATVRGEADCRAFFARFVPALAKARLVETRVCFYNNTPDDDFIIDWHPERKNVLLVTGFSGHGFKFGPLMGRVAADLLLTGRTNLPIDRFGLARFAK